MLDHALRACPGPLWRGRLWERGGERPEFAEFWYIGYHTLFWLDLYLSGAVEGFAPPAPFTLGELDPAGVLPDRTYSREELLGYLAHGRPKCRAAIDALTEEHASRLCVFGWGEASFAELLLYNLRHIQGHATELNLFLGQQTGSAPGWVARAKDSLGGE
jgi:hypothetical protein